MAGRKWVGGSGFKTTISTFFLSFGFFLLFASALPAQHFLEGRWEGTLNDYDSLGVKTTYRVELFLEKEGDEISGRCFVHLSPGKVIAMEVFGHQYFDRSIYLSDQKYLGPDLQKKPPYYRIYQLLPNRSIWKTTLDGYWQQSVSTDPLNKKRRLGTIELKKLDNSKA